MPKEGLEMKIIQLTDEQYETLKSGEDILIKAPPKKAIPLWEPSEGGWKVQGYGGFIHPTTDFSFTTVGAARKTEAQATLMRDRRLRSEKLSAFLAEIGEEKEWVNGEENWYTCIADDKWVENYAYVYYSPEKVYMTKSGAEQVCKALNSGYLVL